MKFSGMASKKKHTDSVCMKVVLSPGSYHTFPALKQNRGIHQLTNYCDALTQARHLSTGNRNARLTVR